MSHNYLEATEENFGPEVEQFAGVALVDFWATWCGPCQMMSPAIDQISEKYKDDAQVKIVKVDVDKNPNLAEKYQVYSIPTVKVFKAGKVVDEGVGVMAVSELTQRIDAQKA